MRTNAFASTFGIRPTTFIHQWNKGDETTLQALHVLRVTEYYTSIDDFLKYRVYEEGVRIESFIIELKDVTLQSAKGVTERALNGCSIGTVIVLYHSRISKRKMVQQLT